MLYHGNATAGHLAHDVPVPLSRPADLAVAAAAVAAAALLASGTARSGVFAALRAMTSGSEDEADGD